MFGLDKLLGGSESEMDFSNHIKGEIIKPTGQVEQVKITRPDRFDHNERIYAVMEPLSNKEDGEKRLVYDEGHPIPRCHRKKSVDSEELMNEINGENIIDQLANPKAKSGVPDLVGWLKEIPPVVWIVILVVFVMLQEGTLGGLMPF